MPSNMLGLIEMALVLTLGLGWGFYELRSLRRGRNNKPKGSPGDAKPPHDGPPA